MQATKRAEAFTSRLREVYGEDLVSVVLYGSAARGDYREGISDLNLVVLLRSTELATLRRGTELAREWAAEGNPPPLMLSETEWRGSADVFPIEYTDMKDANVVLHGSDPFAGLTIDWEHLRLQVEHELKSKQIQLREQYLLLASDPDGLGKLLTRALPTFLTLFRAGLHLAGESAPRDPAAAIAAVSRLVGFDAAPFEEVLRARTTGASFAPAGDGSVTTGYLKGVESTTRWLDGLVGPGAGRA
jgi:hypothetical protein